MNTEVKKLEWAKLLTEAIEKPGKLSEAYTRFHGYSFGNRIWAYCQCEARGIEMGPLASFNKWKELGRSVKKGEKAISLCMPITGKKKKEDGTEEHYSFFAFKNNWFVLSQTEGEAYVAPEIPEWNAERALTALELKQVPFNYPDGNAQGYAAPNGEVAVSELATHPHKTMFHEMAHQVLGHVGEATLSDDERTPRNIREIEAEAVAMLCCASLNLPGVEYSRGYIQHWAKDEPINETSARKIFTAADKILKAGSN